MRAMRFNWDGRSHDIPMSTDSDNFKLHVYMAARGLYSGRVRTMRNASSSATCADTILQLPEFSPSSSARTLRWPLSSVASVSRHAAHYVVTYLTAAQLQRTASQAAHFILLTIAELPRATVQVINKTIAKVQRAVTQVICGVTHILLVLRYALETTVGAITLVSCRVFELVADLVKHTVMLERRYT